MGNPFKPGAPFYPAPYLSTGFGWQPVEPGRAIFFDTLEEKLQKAPLFVFVSDEPERTKEVLRKQSLQDFVVIHRDEYIPATRYIVFLDRSTDTGLFEKPNFLLRLLVHLLRYAPSAAYGRGMLVVSGAHLSQLRHIPARYRRSVEASIAALLSEYFPGSVAQFRVYGNSVYFFHSAVDTMQPEGHMPVLWPNSSMLDAIPWYDNGQNWLWTTLSNDAYGHRQILLDYCGIPSDIQILGKLQHGWQLTTGLDGEQGYKDEVREGRYPFFVWNSKNLENAKAEGLTWGQAIGAPILYLPPQNDPGAAANSLLAFPAHSITEYQVDPDGWDRYKRDLEQTAKQYRFNSITVCLHFMDYRKPEVLASFRSAGMDTICLGELRDPAFLTRFRYHVRRHMATTSERLCSAGMYSLLLNRPFFVSGQALQQNPPNPFASRVTNPEWIKEHYPELAKYDGVCYADAGRKELGMETKREPQELRKLLWGWMED